MISKLTVGVIGIATGAILTTVAWAGPTASDLAQTLQLDEVVDILHAEGMDYAASIEKDMIPGGGGQLWQQTVARLYERARLREGLELALDVVMSDGEIAEVNEFFSTDAGQTILSYENAARAAMSDPAIEELARAAFDDARRSGNARMAQVDRFAEVNDLIERNVAGALSSNYQFLRGLVDGGAFSMSDEDILSDVWGQEEEVRRDTESWLLGFLLMAYQPLDDDAMEAYIAFSETNAGRALNVALFEGFEGLYTEISYALGLAAAQTMSASDL